MITGWIFFICALIILALMAFWPRQRKEQTMGSREFSARLDELDARLVRSEEVNSFVRSGQMIKAIKIYREDTGASLADARAAVERIEAGLRLGIELRGRRIPEEGMSTQSDALDEEIEHLLIQGKKIEAIKLYRERTDVGLREAKDMVDTLESALLLHGPAFAHTTGATPETPDRVPVVMPPGEEVRRLVLAGDKIRAIKLYRDQTGLGLREAKAAVDLLERSFHGMEQA
jgi:ribosomal protein L7/L12